MRLATIIAAFERHEEISEECLIWCYDLALHTTDVFVDTFDAHKEEQAPPKQMTYAQVNQGILAQIREAGIEGIAAREIGRTAPGRHVKSKERDDAIHDLINLGLIRRVSQETIGRPKVMLYALKVDR